MADWDLRQARRLRFERYLAVVGEVGVSKQLCREVRLPDSSQSDVALSLCYATHCTQNFSPVHLNHRFSRTILPETSAAVHTLSLFSSFIYLFI